jgi:hypothetical protein
MERVMAVVVAVIVAALGIICMARPADVQSWFIRTYSNSWVWKINPLSGWMRKPSYRTCLRFMGAYALLFAVLLVYAAYNAR